MDEAPISTIEEHPMKPLMVRPHTIVLKYHRKVPPFNQTIAGRLGAAYLADMSVCRARHSRAGFGPRATLAYVTSYNSVSDLPKNAELCDLSKYVRGRLNDDWSESVVARLAVAEGDSTSYLQEALSRHLETLLEYSDFVECGEGQCPQLVVKRAPRDRRDLLNKHLRDARQLSGSGARFGVSSAYCYEVWKLCDALWGADLDNDGVPGTDVASIVNRHRRLLDWLRDAVAEATDKELSKPSEGEAEDEADGHSARVWTLLLGGRILEACKVCREHGDLNMAVLIAQAAGDPAFRSLVSRQLSQWRACGAETTIARHRLASLRLVAGERDRLETVDWLRALHATARYLCPQVPTLERVIRTYEGFFSQSEEQEENIDLTTIEADEMAMSVPLPPYMEQYDVRENGNTRRVLDLRYELMRARANNGRPRLRPASYSPDPLDYSLCFLLGTWFGHPTSDSITGCADQLEACGLWHLAVQALAYHPDTVVRGHLIRGVLSRHAPATADTPELTRRLQLVERLRVPCEWVLLARAHRAKYEHLPAIEAEHLVNAGQYNAAHRVLLEELQTQAVLGDDLKSIAPLLEKLNEAAQRQQVSGWEAGGQALYHYLHVVDEIRGLVSSPAAPARLEALRPRVAAACRSLRQLQPTTPRHCAARAEMGARLVQLALAAGEPPHHLAALLKALRLPHDCTAHAMYKITTDLAEQASDSCIESATSSPLSSHHRAAIQS
ncbi:hypothetical protein ABMA27_012224 [Loxostege sticticalis]|uniref:Nuclear pore complex protein NUP96 C-terminal domain-containing protein n=1 Tax=Loxostege sticticalis TaxID=481309 RepID=A0ABR3H0W2_LOXSC